MYEIIKNSPPPTPIVAPKVPWSELRIGDAFDVPPMEAQRVRVSASQYRSRNSGWDYTSRTQKSGLIRFWRTR